MASSDLCSREIPDTDVWQRMTTRHHLSGDIGVSEISPRLPLAAPVSTPIRTCTIRTPSGLALACASSTSLPLRELTSLGSRYTRLRAARTMIQVVRRERAALRAVEGLSKTTVGCRG